MSEKRYTPTILLVVAIVCAALALFAPFLRAAHQSEVTAGEFVDVDVYTYYFWGQRYWVVGTKNVISKTSMYGRQNYPTILFGLVPLALALLMGIIALLSKTNFTLKIGGRKRRLGLNSESPIPLGLASGLMFMVYLSIPRIMTATVTLFESKAYIVTTEVAMSLILGGAISFALALMIYSVRSIKAAPY